MPRVTVIIPNHNGTHLLEDCLGSLAAQTYRDFEIVVVDNASTDASRELIRDRYPAVRLIELAENSGFSSAVNAGIRAGDSDLIVLLNNDTRAEAAWLERLVTAMDETPAASFGASKLLRFDAPHHVDAAGDGYSLVRAAAIAIGSGKPAHSYEDRSWVFGACAAAAIYRRSLFEDIGFFDEDFFLIFEDIDIDFRAQIAGHRCVYVPDAIVYHKRGASTDKWSIETQARMLRNRIWAAGKSLPAPLLAVWSVFFVPRLVFGLVRIIAYRQPSPPGARGAMRKFLYALAASLRDLPAKRKSTNGTRRIGTFSMLRRLGTKHRKVKS